MKKKKSRKKVFIRKITKLFFWSSIFFFVFVIAVYIFIQIQFPPEKVKLFVQNELSKALNDRLVHIGNYSLNLVDGLKFDDIIIYEPMKQDSTANDSLKFVSIDKAYLKYRLFSIFRRKVKINEIIIDHPQFNLKIDKQNKANIDDLIAAPAETVPDTTEITQDTSAADVDLLFSLELDKFEFKRFDAIFSIETDSTKFDVEIKDFSIYLSDFHVPRGPLDEIKDKIKAKINISSPKSQWKLYVEHIDLKYPYQFDTQFDMDINVKIDGMDKIKLKGNTGIGEIYVKEFADVIKTTKVPVSKFVDLNFDLNFDAQDGNVLIKQFITEIADEQALIINGSIANIYDEPEYTLTIEDSKIQLSKVFYTIKAILPSPYKNDLDDLKIDGLLSLKNTKIDGNPQSENIENGLKFTTVLNLDNFYFQYSMPEIEINNLAIFLTANGIYNKKGLHDTHLDGKFSIHSMNSILEDSVSIAFRNFTTNLTASFSNEYFPTYVNLKSSIEDIWGGRLDFNFNYNSIKKLAEYTANGLLEFKHLTLNKLPFSQGDGYINSQLSLNSTSLDSIDIKLDIFSDTLYFPVENERLVVSPLALKGKIDAAIDAKFNNLAVRKFDVTINDYLELEGNATLLEWGNRGFSANISSLFLDHKKVFAFIPELYKQDLENLIIDGSTFLSCSLNGSLPEESDPEIELSVNSIIKANIDYADIPMNVDHFEGRIDIISNVKQTDMNVSASVKNLLLPEIRHVPLENTKLSFKLRTPNFIQANIDSLALIIPDLASNIMIVGTIDSLDSNPGINLEMDYMFLVDDKTLLIDDLYATGYLNSKIILNMKSHMLELDGSFDFNKFTVFMNELFEVKGLFAQIQFKQKIDLDNLKPIKDNEDNVILTDISSLNYQLFRPYYDDIEDKSFIKIDSINFAGYDVSNVIMELNLGNGQINIPYIGMDIYDGNMQGNIAADLPGFNMAKVDYYIKANISKLNSAKLSPIVKGSAKESELNLNLELNGIGLDPDQDIDVGGFFYITKIGSKFTDNVLTSLDPKRTDKSIQSTRKMLKWGYKPKLISLELKHGYLYPTIHLTKGNFITKLLPFNLSGGKVELARIPMILLLKPSMKEVD